MENLTIGLLGGNVHGERSWGTFPWTFTWTWAKVPLNVHTYVPFPIRYLFGNILELFLLARLHILYNSINTITLIIIYHFQNPNLASLAASGSLFSLCGNVFGVFCAPHFSSFSHVHSGGCVFYGLKSGSSIVPGYYNTKHAIVPLAVPEIARCKCFPSVFRRILTVGSQADKPNPSRKPTQPSQAQPNPTRAQNSLEIRGLVLEGRT